MPGLLLKMQKRKLCNCSQCGVWHGSPFGKFCNWIEEAFDGLNTEMNKLEATGSAAGICSDEQKSSKAQAESWILVMLS